MTLLSYIRQSLCVGHIPPRELVSLCSTYFILLCCLIVPSMAEGGREADRLASWLTVFPASFNSLCDGR